MATTATILDGNKIAAVLWAGWGAASALALAVPAGALIPYLAVSTLCFDQNERAPRSGAGASQDLEGGHDA